MASQGISSWASQHRQILLAALIAAIVFTSLIRFTVPVIQSVGLRNRLGNSRAITATVVDQWTLSDENSATDYYLRYQYEVVLLDESRTTFTREEMVGKSLYESTQIGASLPIRYNPTDPSLAMTQIGVENSLGDYVTISCSLCCSAVVIAGLPAFLASRTAWGRRRLAIAEARRLARQQSR